MQSKTISVVQLHTERSIRIGENIKVKLIRIHGGVCRFCLNSPSSVGIYRQEFFRKILESGQDWIDSLIFKNRGGNLCLGRYLDGSILFILTDDLKADPQNAQPIAQLKVIKIGYSWAQLQIDAPGMTIQQI